jgi:isocitrate lyase
VRGREQLRAFRHVILRYRRIGPVVDAGYGNAVNVIRTRDYEQAGVAAVRLEDQATPPSAAGTSVVPAEHIVAKLRRHQLKGRLPARRAATLRCACQAATLAHLRARFDLTTHGKIPAARLGYAA